jgi:hypothetical protein
MNGRNEKGKEAEIQTKISFELGEISSTPSAVKLLEEAGEIAATYLDRHRSGDWGLVNKSETTEKKISLIKDFMVASVYELPQTGKYLAIITETDRSKTTILLCSEVWAATRAK